MVPKWLGWLSFPKCSVLYIFEQRNRHPSSLDSYNNDQKDHPHQQAAAMPFFHHLFKSPKRSPHHNGVYPSIVYDVLSDSSSDSRFPYSPLSQSQQSHVAPASRDISPGEIVHQLQQVRTHADLTASRIHYLQMLIDYEGATIAQVTELKRQLKETHRELEGFHRELQSDHGDDSAQAVRDVVREVWKAYRRMVKLEERLRGEDGSSTSSTTLTVVKYPPSRRRSTVSADGTEGRQLLYLTPVTSPETTPGSGGLKKRKRLPHDLKRSSADVEREKTLITGALPGLQSAIRDTSSEVINILRDLPQLIAKNTHSQLSVVKSDGPTSNDGRSSELLHTNPSLSSGAYDKSRRRVSSDGHRSELLHTNPSLSSGAYRNDHKSEPCHTDPPRSRRAYSIRSAAPPEETHPELWPQPRDQVIERLRKEESNTFLHLREPDRVRRGSCNGFMISTMALSGVQDPRFVLPHLHHIKPHEIRLLKQWLILGNYVRPSGPISRTEKLLHGIQLLQTGNRYETIAVVFSRSPRHIRNSCHDVLTGLLMLYNATVTKDTEREVYAPLWGICDRFAADETSYRAEVYYGFRWTEVANALIALNLFIGRCRGSDSSFDGQPFQWGKYLVDETIRRVPDERQGVPEVRSSNASIQESDAGSDYDAPVIRVVPR